MFRLENHAANPPRFFEVDVNGDEVTFRFGKVGEKGRSQTSKRASPEDAQKGAMRTVMAKLGEGFRLVDHVFGKEDLDRLDMETVDNSEHCSVFMFRPVLEFVDSLEHVDDGFAYAVRAEYEDNDILGRLSHLIACERADRLKAMVIGFWGEDVMSGDKTTEIAELLTSHHDQLPALEALFFADVPYQECELSWLQIGDVAPFLCFPGLKHFKTRGNGTLRSPVELPDLRSLVWQSTGLQDDTVRAIGESALPSLEHLDLWTGCCERDGVGSPSPLDPLLNRPPPKLKSLGLRNSEFHNALIPAIVESAVFRQVEHLDLSMGSVADPGATVLAEALEKDTHNLKRVSLQWNTVTEPVRNRLLATGLEFDLRPLNAHVSDFGDGPHYFASITE